jgi:hypothetical protein
MPDPTMRSSKPVTGLVRQNSYVPHNRIRRAALQSKQTSVSSGCIVAKQEVIRDCGVSTRNGYETMAVSPDNHWLAAAPSNQLTDVAVWNLTELIAACPSDTAVSADRGAHLVLHELTDGGANQFLVVVEPKNPSCRVYT